MKNLTLNCLLACTAICAAFSLPSQAQQRGAHQQSSRSKSSYENTTKGLSSSPAGNRTTATSSAPSREASGSVSSRKSSSSYSQPARNVQRSGEGSASGSARETTGPSRNVQRIGDGVSYGNMGKPSGRSNPGSESRKQNYPSNYYGGREPRRVDMDKGPGRDVYRVEPRRRESMPYHTPARFCDRGHHYYGYRISCLPPRYECIHHFGMDYYLYDGVYYRPFGGSYYVCRPPFGVSFVPSVSASALSILHFAFFASVANSYDTINENAAIITEQNAIIAQNNATLARQHEALALNSNRAARSYNLANRLGLVQSYASAQTEYFYDDGVFFVKSADGRYLTIVPPAGALVRELPDDYDEITIEDNIYYKVDDTVYRAAVVDGSLYFEVLGQLTGNLAARYRLN